MGRCSTDAFNTRTIYLIEANDMTVGAWVLLVAGLLGFAVYWLIALRLIGQHLGRERRRLCIWDSVLLFVGLGAGVLGLALMEPALAAGLFRDAFRKLGVGLLLMFSGSAVVWWYAAKWGRIVFVLPLVLLLRGESAVERWAEITQPPELRHLRVLKWWQWVIVLTGGLLAGLVLTRLESLLTRPGAPLRYSPLTVTAILCALGLAMGCAIGAVMYFVLRGTTANSAHSGEQEDDSS